ncbi:MAG: L-ribulose-5-phosphate 4-epimerase [Clostridiales bacterium]|nr:L-ribulose-5-phosphate 4-epimerase [Clostridiales bacterium]
MLSELKVQVYKANMYLSENGLAPFTWGNASGIDRERGIIIIKPSGVPYSQLSPESMVELDLDGNCLSNNLRPSSDTPTHVELYKAFPDIKGVVHTHSVNAVAFAQAGMPIPAFGTTHADFCYGEIPCARGLTEDEINGEYEKNTGLVIVECFKEKHLDPNAVPGVLVRSHGVFTWGSSPMNASVNAGTLEIVADMAMKTLSLNGGAQTIPQYLLDRHYFRKHGANAYYGQSKN